MTLKNVENLSTSIHIDDSFWCVTAVYVFVVRPIGGVVEAEAAAAAAALFKSGESDKGNRKLAVSPQEKKGKMKYWNSSQFLFFLNLQFFVFVLLAACGHRFLHFCMSGRAKLFVPPPTKQ